MATGHKRLILGMAGGLVALAAAVGAYVSWTGDGGPATPADPANPALVAQGRALYAQHCASCHGADLQGETVDWRTRKANGSLPAPPHDASGHTWHHPDQQLFAITKRGIAPFAPAGYVSDMPAFAPVLSDGEIWSILAYIKSTWPEQARTAQQARTDQAAQAGQGN